MADRDEVIKGLEKVWDAFNHMEHELYADYVYDALELLKPIEPIEERLDEVNSIYRYRCGNCNTHFYYRQQKYCVICGRMAKWDD